ncbi:MAG: N-acetyltransferase family protein [Sandaracinaceae bacterium]
MVVEAQVRTAHRSDASELARVHLSSWRWAYRGLLPDAHLRQMHEPDLVARWRARLEMPELDESIRVVESQGQIRGFATSGPLRDDPSWLGHAGEVYMLYVEPSAVGHGLGRELLDACFEEMTRCRCHWAVVWVLARNERARAFYESCGLRLDGGRRWDAFGDRAVPVLRYAKALNPVFDFDAMRARARTR